MKRFVWVAALLLLPVALLITQIRAELLLRDPTGAQSLHRYLYETPTVGGLPFKPRAFARWVLVGSETGLRSLGRAPDVQQVDRGLQFIALWGALLTTALLACRYLEPPWALTAALITALWSCWGFLSLGYNAGYPYDLPALLLSCLGLLAIVSGKFTALALVIAFGTLNKETTLWLIPAYGAVAALEVRRRTLATRILILLVIYIAAYQLTRLLGSSLPTNVSVRQRALTASFFAGPDRTAPRLLFNLKELAFQGRGGLQQNVYWALLIHLPALLSYRSLPAPLQRLLWALPIFIGPMFLVGNIWEVRIFLEILPLGAVTAVYVLSRRFPAPAAGQSKTA